MENLFEERKEIGIKFKKLKRDSNQDYSKRTMSITLNQALSNDTKKENLEKSKLEEYMAVRNSRLSVDFLEETLQIRTD